MGIRRGEDWGVRGPIPADAVPVDGDRHLARVIASYRERDEPLAPFRLRSGDLFRSLGGRQSADPVSGATGGEAVIASCDLAVIEGSFGRQYFVAHVILRRRLWSGPLFAAMNVPFVGDWNLAPRAHPGDGFLDVITGRLGWRDRWSARRRVRTGTHLPHPSLSYERRREIEIDPAARQLLLVDGEQLDLSGPLRLAVEPDAFTVIV